MKVNPYLNISADAFFSLYTNVTNLHINKYKVKSATLQNFSVWNIHDKWNFLIFTYLKFLIDNYTKNKNFTKNKRTTLTDHQSKMRSKSKVNNKDTRATSMTSLWSIHCKPKAHHNTRPSATITDTEWANAKWYVSCYYPNKHYFTYPHSNNNFRRANNLVLYN